MLRLQKFRCAMDGPFEELLTLDPSDGDARFDKVRSHPCPTCGESCPSVIEAPAVRMDRIHTVEFGGRTMTRDSVEQALDQKSTTTDFWDKPDFERGFLQRAAKVIKKELSGDLPTATADIPADAQIAKATANVDHEAVQAHQDQVTNFIRKTEFPE